MAHIFEKAVSEDYDIDLNWASPLDRRPPGQTLATVAIAVTRTDTGADATSIVCGGSNPAVVSGEKAPVNVRAGSAGVEYHFVLTCGFSGGAILIEHWYMRVTT